MSGLLAAAAAVTATVLITRPVPAEVLASARLDPLESGEGLTGAAVVERTDAGGRDIVVRLDGSPQGDDYREVWLLSPEFDRLISLGTLTGASGRFALPAGVELADYPVVDISVEPLDGDPAHSGDSILRGDLHV